MDYLPSFTMTTLLLRNLGSPVARELRTVEAPNIFEQFVVFWSTRMLDIGDEIEKAYCDVGVALLMAQEVYREDLLVEPAAGTLLNEAIIKMYDAIDTLVKLRPDRPSVQQTIFPSIGAASDYLEGLPKGDNLYYRLKLDDAGRCTIQEFKLARVL
jgi:hypothetical protein